MGNDIAIHIARMMVWARLNPLEAEHRAELERRAVEISCVIGVPIKAAEPITNLLRDEYGLSFEGLKHRLLRGDDDLWRRVEEMKALWHVDESLK